VWRFESAQILQIECPESVFSTVLPIPAIPLSKAVSEQNDERSSTAAQLRPANRARAAPVESAIAFRSIFHPRIRVADTAPQLLPAHPIRERASQKYWMHARAPSPIENDNYSLIGSGFT